MPADIINGEGLPGLLFAHRWRLFVLAMVIFLSTLAGNSKLYTESDYRIFFDHDDPNLVAHELIETEYTNSDNVTFVISSKNLARDLFNSEDLTALTELTNRAWQLPFAVRVDSITNYQYSSAENDEVYVGDLIPEEALSDNDKILQISTAALSEPQIINRIISNDAKTTSVIATLRPPFDQQKAEKAIFEAVAAARLLQGEMIEKYPNLDFRLTGQSTIVAAFNDLTMRDMGTLFPLMLGVSFILLALLLRSIIAALISLLVLVLTLISTFGMAGYLGYAINQVNAITPIIVLTIAICDCVHLFDNYFKLSKDKDDRNLAMRTALEKTLHPIWLTTVTTMIGFISMNFSDSPPFRSLGTLTALGVGFAFVFSICLIPSLGKFATRSNHNRPQAYQLLLRACETLLLKPRKKVLIIGSLISLSIALFTFNNELNDNTIGYFKKSVPVREATDFMQAHLTGFDTISYSINSGKANGINDPEYLKKVDAFIGWYKSQPEVVSVVSYVDILKRLNKNMHNDNGAFYKIPANPELAAQYLLLYELSLPFGVDLNNLINFDKSSLKVSAIIKDQKAQQLIELEAKAQEWMAENTPELQTQGAGISLLFAHVGQNNIYSMVNGVIFALVLITITLSLSFRSFKLGLISALPNLMPALIAMGLWGIFVSQVNLAVAAILSITMGLVVDDTVHFMHKYLIATRDLKKSHLEAVKYTYAEVGSALITTSIVLTMGFAVLALSDFNVNAHMGLMVSITIIIALLFDLLMLPAILGIFVHSNSVS